jgi:hypothetical protein
MLYCRALRSTLLYCVDTFSIFVHNKVRDLGTVPASSLELRLDQTLSAELRREGLYCALLRGEHS